MHRIAAEIPVAAVAAAMMASIVFIAGTAIASRDEVRLSYTVQPALCAPSYCEPATVQPEASVPLTTAQEADRQTQWRVESGSAE